MRLVAESNGISATRGLAESSTSFSSPAFAAATTRAPSVGSPWMPGPCSPCVRRASEASAPAASSSSSSKSGVTAAPFQVKLPFGS